MSLEKQVMTDLKTAMKAKDQVAMRTLRAIKSAILLKQTDGSGDTLEQADEIKLVQKLVKQRQDSLDIYEKQDREDLAVTEREEIAVLQRYLPEQMGEDELRGVIQEIITSTGASSMKDMGKVMGMANGRLAGKADGKTIATVVKQLLS
jgi:uncharacterized protein YqeY